MTKLANLLLLYIPLPWATNSFSCRLNVNWVTCGGEEKKAANTVRIKGEEKEQEKRGGGELSIDSKSKPERWETNGLKNKSGGRGCAQGSGAEVLKGVARALGFVLSELGKAAGIGLALWGRCPLCDQTLKPFCHPVNRRCVRNVIFKVAPLSARCSRPFLFAPPTCLLFRHLHLNIYLSSFFCSTPAAFTNCDEHSPERNLLLPARGEHPESSVCSVQHDPPPVCPLSPFFILS